MKNPSRTKGSAELRCPAPGGAGEPSAPDPVSRLKPAEMRQMVRELLARQADLELQNGELRHEREMLRGLNDQLRLSLAARPAEPDPGERKREEQRQQFQIEFLRIVAEASSALTSASTDAEFDPVVNRSLERLGELFGADRCYVFQFTGNLERMINTHEWCAEGVQPQKDHLQDLRTEDMPWWTRQMLDRNPVHLPDIEKLPQEAAAEKREFRAQNIRSILCLPTLNAEGVLTGFFGFDMVRRAHHWPEDQIVMLRLLADALGGALARRQMEAALAESEARFHTIFDTAADGMFLWEAASERFCLANKACLDMFGYTWEEFAQLRIEDLTAGKDAGFVRGGPRRGRRGQAKPERRGELRFQRKDGSPLFTEFQVVALNLRGRDHVLAAIRDISERKRLEEEVNAIIEHERQRIGRDLHDSVNQLIAGSAYLAHAVGEDLKRKFAPESEAVLKLAGCLRQASRKVREIVQGLHPEELNSGTLVQALQEMGATARDLFGIDCQLRATSPIRLIESKIVRELYRIVQEAVNNAAKHSRGTRIWVRLAQGPNQLALTVRDNGLGMAEAAASGAGMGLRTMQYRAGMIGALLRIRSVPGRGTTVRCVLPIPVQAGG